MNKYTEYNKKYNKREQRIENIKDNIVAINFYKELIFNGSIKETISLINKCGNNLMNYLYLLSLYNDATKDFIKKNILDKYNRDCVIVIFMIKLTYLSSIKDIECIKTTMESFKETKLIKDISYNEETCTFKIITLNNESVHFKSLATNKEDALMFKNECHDVTYRAINNFDWVKDVVTIKHIDLNNTIVYHSFLISKSDTIVDIARNIVMKYDDLKKLIDYKLILYMKKDDVVRNIENISIRDKEFNESTLDPLLKYALRKEMKKKRLCR